MNIIIHNVVFNQHGGSPVVKIAIVDISLQHCDEKTLHSIKQRSQSFFFFLE